MAEDDEIRLTLRLPERIRDDLMQRARQSGRSLNAEIVNRLDRSLSDDDMKELQSYFIDVDGRLEKAEYKLNILWAERQGHDPSNGKD